GRPPAVDHARRLDYAAYRRLWPLSRGPPLRGAGRQLPALSRRAGIAQRRRQVPLVLKTATAGLPVLLGAASVIEPAALSPGGSRSRQGCVLRPAAKRPPLPSNPARRERVPQALPDGQQEGCMRELDVSRRRFLGG